jgi:hypothetical protein
MNKFYAHIERREIKTEAEWRADIEMGIAENFLTDDGIYYTHPGDHDDTRTLDEWVEKKFADELIAVDDE